MKELPRDFLDRIGNTSLLALRHIVPLQKPAASAPTRLRPTKRWRTSYLKTYGAELSKSAAAPGGDGGK